MLLFRFKFHYVGLFFILALCSFPFTAAQSSPSVITTIKPLQLIAAAISDGVTTPIQLLPDNASPHSFSMRPSDMQNLADASLIFWIGPDMEIFLTRALERSNATQVHFYEESSQNDTHDHSHDSHIWLSPLHAVEIATRMADHLTRLFPQQAEQIRSNLDAFNTQLQQADQAINAQLKPYRDKGFFVFHDAYGHFVEHYGLNQLGYFTLDPSRKPGAKSLIEIRRTLQETAATCVFSEPQFSSAIVTSLIKNTPSFSGELDPLGRDVIANPEGYVTFLHNLANNFVDCLKN